jgi:hypothetical protein
MWLKSGAAQLRCSRLCEIGVSSAVVGFDDPAEVAIVGETSDLGPFVVVYEANYEQSSFTN